MKNVFSLIVIILFSMLLLTNCTAIYFEEELTEDTAQEVTYKESISVSIVEFVLTSKDDSLNNIKDSITSYILSRLQREIKQISLRDRLLVSEKDSSSIIYKKDRADDLCKDMLKGEYEEFDEEKEKEDAEDDNYDDDLFEKKEESEKEKESNDDAESEKKAKEDADLTGDTEDVVITELENSNINSELKNILGKDVADVMKEDISVYDLTAPEAIIKSDVLKPDDFKDEIMMFSKLINFDGDIVIGALVQIQESKIEITVYVVNALLKEIMGKYEFNIDRTEYQMGNIDIEPMVWKEIKKLFLGENIASLKINTNISNTLVYIDDEYMGRAEKISSGKYQFNMDVISSGSHKIRIIKQGYEDIEGYIHLNKNKTSVINIELEELKSSSKILIYSELKDADVWLDMDYKGTIEDTEQAFIIDNVKEGVHKIRIEKEGYNPFIYKAEVDGINDSKVEAIFTPYDEKLYDPDMNSSVYRALSDVFLYTTIFSLAATVGLFYEFGTIDDEKFGIEKSFPSDYADMNSYYDTMNNHDRIQTWKDTFSYSTVIFVLSTIAFKWIELEHRDIIVGGGGKSINVEPDINIPNNDMKKLTFGINFSYHF